MLLTSHPQGALHTQSEETRSSRLLRGPLAPHVREDLLAREYLPVVAHEELHLHERAHGPSLPVPHGREVRCG